MLTNDAAFGAISQGSHYRPGDEWDAWCLAAARTFETATRNTALAQKYYERCTCNAGGINKVDIAGRAEALVFGVEYVAPSVRPPCSWGPPLMGGQGFEAPQSILGHIQRGLPPHFTSNLEHAKKGEAWNYWRWGNELKNEAANVASEIRKFLSGSNVKIPTQEPIPSVDTGKNEVSKDSSGPLVLAALAAGGFFLFGGGA